MTSLLLFIYIFLNEFRFFLLAGCPNTCVLVSIELLLFVLFARADFIIKYDMYIERRGFI